MRKAGGAEPQSAFLRVVVVGPSPTRSGAAGRHTGALARALSEAGHEVTFVGSPIRGGWRSAQELVRADAIVLVHSGARALPTSTALLRGVGLVAPHPRVVLISAADFPERPRTASERMTASLVRRCDALLVHDEHRARQARALGAGRVSVSARPTSAQTQVAATSVRERPQRETWMSAGAGSSVWTRGSRSQTRPGTAAEPADGPGLTAEWARYVGTIESLVAPLSVPPADGQRPEPEHSTRSARAAWQRLRGAVSRSRRANRGSERVALTARELPEWVKATDVLVDVDEAMDVTEAARSAGLPGTDDPVAAWAAYGSLAAVVRLVDDGSHACVIVDESGPHSLLRRWARCAGFAPVTLGLVADTVPMDIDLASLDVVVQVPPEGCDPDVVDELVGTASWALRRGGLLVVTLPLGIVGVAGAVTIADLRGVVARAADCGLTLVGDLDGELCETLAFTAAGATDGGAVDAAYGLARLTFRRS